MSSEDITFCAYDCSNTECIRNKKNIKQHWLDHSYSYFPECKDGDIKQDEFHLSDRTN